jgi:hypothetical protein
MEAKINQLLADAYIKVPKLQNEKLETVFVQPGRTCCFAFKFKCGYSFLACTRDCSDPQKKWIVYKEY